MIKYFGKVWDIVQYFPEVQIERLPMEGNSHADAPARLAVTVDAPTLLFIPVESLDTPSILKDFFTTFYVDMDTNWMDPISNYLRD